MNPGINVSKKNLPVDIRIAHLTGDKMKVPGRAIAKMVKENEHNKYTTTYYLFAQKHEKGELYLGKYEYFKNLEDSTDILTKENMKNDHMKLKLVKKGNIDSRVSKELKRKYHGSNRIE